MAISCAVPVGEGMTVKPCCIHSAHSYPTRRKGYVVKNKTAPFLSSPVPTADYPTATMIFFKLIAILTTVTLACIAASTNANKQCPGPAKGAKNSSLIQCTGDSKVFWSPEW